MSILIALFLGVVQGLTEFLPVSSSGHLVLFQKIFGINVDCLLFDIVLHLGTLVAVCVVYRKSIWQILKNPFCEKGQKLLFATLPTVIIAVLFKDFFKSSFDGGLLWVGFLVTAAFMFFADYSCKNNYQYKNLGYGHSVLMGVFQGVAILPGISRSGSTITSAMVMGVRRNQSAEFSFLMSIPAILGSLIFELFDMSAGALTVDVLPLVLGFVSSAISGYFAIKIMLKVIKKARFVWFGIYMLLLSVFMFFNQYVFCWF